MQKPAKSLVVIRPMNKLETHVTEHGRKAHYGGIGPGLVIYTFCGRVLQTSRPALSRDKICRVCARIRRHFHRKPKK